MCALSSPCLLVPCAPPCLQRPTTCSLTSACCASTASWCWSDCPLSLSRFPQPPLPAVSNPRFLVACKLLPLLACCCLQDTNHSLLRVCTVFGARLMLCSAAYVVWLMSRPSLTCVPLLTQQVRLQTMLTCVPACRNACAERITVAGSMIGGIPETQEMLGKAPAACQLTSRRAGS